MKVKIKVGIEIIDKHHCSEDCRYFLYDNEFSSATCESCGKYDGEYYLKQDKVGFKRTKQCKKEEVRI